MRGICDTKGKTEMFAEFWLENLKETYYLEELGVEDWTILKQILKKQKKERSGLKSSDSRTRSCRLGFHKMRQFCD
jgi:hypothetical protein